MPDASTGQRTVGDILDSMPAGDDLVLVFDTETTGLPIFSSPSDHPDQPHIVSLAAELCRSDGTVIETYNQIVKIGVPIPADTIAIHGITDEIANSQGIDPKQMLADFFALVERASVVLGYNTGFDLRMVRIQSARHLGTKWECPKPKDDAMWIVTKAFNCKKPKLTAAYEMVFGRTFDGAHNALADTTAAREIYFEMRDRGHVAANPRVAIGGNSPPEEVVEATPAVPETAAAVTPLQAHTANIEDIEMEARNWLDGAAIENQGQADEVTRILDLAKKAGKAAEAQRVTEKKPHDDAAAAVQKVWKPLIDKTGRIETGCKGALGKWLLAEQARQRKEAEDARREADRIAEAARQAHIEAQSSGNLDAIEDAEVGLKEVKQVEREAIALDRAKPVAKVEGMSRGVGLTTVWDVALTGDDGDAQALAKHYWITRRADVVEFYLGLAKADVRAGIRSIPGTNVTPRQVAR